MQLSGNKDGSTFASLSELRAGESAILDHFDLPADEARRLMEVGFVPGILVAAARSAPGGDPRVYRVDGSEIAMRRETASRLRVRDRRQGSCDV